MAIGRDRTKISGSSLTGAIGFRAGPGSSDSILPQNMTRSEIARCQDVVGNPYGDNGLNIWKDSKSVQPISGPSREAVAVNAPYIIGAPVPSYFEGAGMDDYYFWPGRADSSVLGNKLLSRTNPSRPVVDVPVFLFELKDLPGMIRQAGDAIRWVKNAAKRSQLPKPTAAGMANANLAYQFGWAPLISDLLKLADFGSAVTKKRQQLGRLYSKGGLRSNIELASDARASDSIVTVQSYGPLIKAARHRSGKTKTWGSVRWTPTFDPSGSTTPSEWDAVRAAFGLDITLSTVWEALPWSWLVDWFTDMGDILAAHRNTIPATPGRMCIMYMEETVSVYTTNTASAGFSWGGATTQSVYKSRLANVNPGILPTGYIPFLGDSQLSILGSLAITRANARR